MAGRGIIGKDFDVLRQIALVSQLRGLDSTGVYQVNSVVKNASGLLVKNAWDFNYFNMFHRFAGEGNKKILNDVSCDVVIGHVRAATKGAINDDNAHPFEFDNLVGAHNGTLRQKRYSSNECTDSELMFGDMNKRGMVPVLSEMMPEDAFALVMFDREDRKLYFARNKHRTFYVTHNDERSVMYWASEAWMLDAILGRADIKHRGLENTPQKCVASGIDKLYQVDVRDIRPKKYNIYHVTDLEYKPVEVKEEPKGPLSRLPISSGYDNWDWEGAEEYRQWWEGTGKNEEPKNSTTKSEKKEETQTVIVTGKSNNTLDLFSDCLHCNKSMAPIDRYYGTQVENAAGEQEFVCEDCTKLMSDIVNNKEVVVN